MNANNIPAGPNASDNGACVQPASGEVAQLVMEIKMRALNAASLPRDPHPRTLQLKALDAAVDRLAALAATPASPQASAPRAVVGEASEQAALTHEQIATFGLGLEYVHDVLRWAACGYVHTPERIAQLHTSYRIVDGIINATPSPADPHQGADALREALAELIACKDLKDQIGKFPPRWPFPTHETDEQEAIRQDYARRKPLAWTAARAALAQHQAPQQGEAT